MNPTHLLYQEDARKLSCSAQVETVFSQDGKDIVVLDQTIFQPHDDNMARDKGIILSSTGEFVVEQVQLLDDIVYHIGFFRHGMFPAFNKGRFTSGTTVECRVHAESRSNTELF